MTSNKNHYFCNNCGKNGHTFNQCKNPITSVGIICFTKHKGGFKFLLICRKDSLGYIEYLRGKYPLYNKKYIQNLINEMSIDEKNKLLTNDFKTLWKNLWGDFYGINYHNENNSSEEKFKQIKRGIKLGNNDEFCLKTLIENSTTDWDSPEWGFPKGRRNNQETDITCGLREWEEETGYCSKNISIIKNLLPFEEIFMGSNFKTYKHKYFLAYINENKIPLEKDYQKSEVSDMKWMTLDEAQNSIRHYNLEKKDILNKVKKILSKYRLIS
jgi:8-oxo-dGTP pyrophosphatase MutT (NUDIX family)